MSKDERHQDLRCEQSRRDDRLLMGGCIKTVMFARRTEGLDDVERETVECEYVCKGALSFFGERQRKRDTELQALTHQLHSIQAMAHK